MRKLQTILVGLLTVVLIHSCANEATKQPEGSWIKGSSQEQLDLIEKQFRGFDMAMVETGYRYQELFWAGSDGNWPYAEYQVAKIKKAITNGLERRPKRAASAKDFMSTTLPAMEAAITTKDSAKFQQAFVEFTLGCNKCHGMEKVPHFSVQKPTKRASPIKL